MHRADTGFHNCARRKLSIQCQHTVISVDKTIDNIDRPLGCAIFQEIRMRCLHDPGICQPLNRNTLYNAQHIGKNQPFRCNLPDGSNSFQHNFGINSIGRAAIHAVGFIQQIKAQQIGRNILVVLCHKTPELHKDFLRCRIVPQGNLRIVSTGIEAGHIVQVKADMDAFFRTVVDQIVHSFQIGRIHHGHIAAVENHTRVQRRTDKVETQCA